jgi:uroporphyrinogen decarboxylase
VALYLDAQIAAGVDAVMLFDTWGGALSHGQYLEFSLVYARQVLELLKNRRRDGKVIPTILFTKGGGQWLEAMAETGYDALGLDWTTDIAAARARVGDRVALQGNLDPVALYAGADAVRGGVREILDAYGDGTGHVFNLGHGVHPDISPENVGAMIDEVHQWSPRHHRA